MRLAVVDASVALAWVIPDEELAPKAVRILLAHHGNQVRLIAPSLWEYEVGNALKVGVTRGRLSEQEGKEALRCLLDLGIALANFREVADRAWQLAIEIGLSVYDAAYVALAEQRVCELYTGDKRLANAAAGTGRIRWIEEFE